MKTINVPEAEYRQMKRALKRQEKAKRLAYDLWLLFCNTKKAENKKVDSAGNKL